MVGPNGLEQSTSSVSTTGTAKVRGSRLRHHIVGVGILARNNLGSGTPVYFLFSAKTYSRSRLIRPRQSFLTYWARRPNVRSAPAHRHKLLSGATVPDEGECASAIREDICDLANGKRDLIGGSSSGGTANLSWHSFLGHSLRFRKSVLASPSRTRDLWKGAAFESPS